MAIRWSNLDTLANAQILGGAYLGSEDGKYVIMARRYRHGDKGRRQYVVHYTTVEYVGSYRTGGANRTLYDGTSLEKAKAAAEVAAGSSGLRAEKSITESIHREDRAMNSRSYPPSSPRWGSTFRACQRRH
jgi:hypothetical protein